LHTRAVCGSACRNALSGSAGCGACATGTQRAATHLTALCPAPAALRCPPTACTPTPHERRALGLIGTCRKHLHAYMTHRHLPPGASAAARGHPSGGGWGLAQHGDPCASRQIWLLYTRTKSTSGCHHATRKRLLHVAGPAHILASPGGRGCLRRRHRCRVRMQGRNAGVQSAMDVLAACVPCTLHPPVPPTYSKMAVGHPCKGSTDKHISRGRPRRGLQPFQHSHRSSPGGLWSELDAADLGRACGGPGPCLSAAAPGCCCTQGCTSPSPSDPGP
jgi:hypothetical protein